MAKAKMCAVIVAAVVGVVGCGGQDSPRSDVPAGPNLDPPVRYTTEWTAPAGTDLFSRTSELVRVSVESGDYALAFGASGSFDEFPPFPGYLEAIGAPQDGDSRYTPWYFARSPEKPDSVDWAQHYHIARVNNDGKAIDATVCGYGLGPDSTENSALSPIKDAIHVQLSTGSDTPGLPGISDTDAAARDPRAHFLPSWNVFGDWKIDGMVHAALSDDDSIAAPCAEWWSAQFPTFVRKGESQYLSPPDGYVFPTAPDNHLQYPEWIGPSDAS